MSAKNSNPWCVACKSFHPKPRNVKHRAELGCKGGRKMNNDPLEKVIETKVCDHAKALGILAYKFTSPAKRSVPDRLFIMPKSKGTFFIEFKRKGKVPSEAQEIEIAKIRAQGSAVFVIDNIECGMCLVADMFHGKKCLPRDDFKAGYCMQEGTPTNDWRQDPMF